MTHHGGTASPTGEFLQSCPGYVNRMSYRFDHGETIPDGVRRIAREQIDDALDLLAEPAADDVEDAVHEVRKNCKKLRGMVRLVRPGMGDDYTTANATFRDAARELSSIRDAHALLETFDELVAAHASRVHAEGLTSVRAELSRRATAASDAVADDDERIEHAHALLLEGRDRINDWPLEDDVDILGAGAAKTYKRGRKRLRDSMSDPTDETLHQWRKRVKYTWYHVRLVRDSAPSVLKPLVKRFHDLSDVLGDDHDLAVLTEQLHAAPEAFGGHAAVGRAMEVIDASRDDLQRRGRSLGSRLYVESPSAFAERISGYWSTWQEYGDELKAGEITDLASVDDDLAQRPVRELYAIAQDLDIGGRSRMDRDDLIGAIRAAGWVAA